MKLLLLVVTLTVVVSFSAGSVLKTSLNNERLIDSSEANFPYHVAILLYTRTGSHWCSGALIGSTWILTTAHCTERASDGYVYLGITKNNVNAESRKVFSQDAIHQHPSYDPLRRANDLSLINIASVSYSPSLFPVRLPSTSLVLENYAAKQANVTGWATYSSSPVIENFNKLMNASFSIMSNAYCADYYDTSLITGYNICVRNTDAKPICMADPGSPLVIDQELVGIASFVLPTYPFVNCNSTAPARFVRITGYLDWVKLKTGISY